jgi:hypothetical protein
MGHSHRAATGPKGAEVGEVLSTKEIARVPELASLPDSFRRRATIERFESGLEIVLEGIASIYAAGR